MACTFGTGMSGVRAVRRSLADGPLARVLTYHRFGDSRHDPFCVAGEDFAAQMQLLADEGRAISLQQLQQFVAGQASVPQDACLVTIDDGMLSTLTEALPVLQKYNVPAVAFVSTALAGRTASVGPERYLNWDELRELSAAGLIEIGSHADTHRSMGLMPLDEARTEMQRSRQKLQDELNTEVASFAYPFGTHSDFNPATDAALTAAGYSVAFSSIHGSVRRAMAPISLPRVKVEGGESLAMFDRISRGGMDAWCVVDRSLWRLQRVRSEIS